MCMTFIYVTFANAPKVNLSLLFRRTQKEQVQCKAAEAAEAVKATEEQQKEQELFPSHNKLLTVKDTGYVYRNKGPHYL